MWKRARKWNSSKSKDWWQISHSMCNYGYLTWVDSPKSSFRSVFDRAAIIKMTATLGFTKCNALENIQKGKNYWYCPSKMIPVDPPGWFHTGRPLEGKQFPLQAREQVTLNVIAIMHQPFHHWITLTRISPASNCGGTWERLFSERFKRVIKLLPLLLFALVWKSCYCFYNQSSMSRVFHDTRSPSSPAEI